MFSDLFSFDVLLEMSSIFMNVEGCEEKQEAASKMVRSNTVLTQV